MNIVALLGSTRKNGNTCKVIGAIEKELRELAAKYGEDICLEKVDLSAANVSYCRGCRACFEKGEAFCPCRDGLPGVVEKIRHADGLILASPVYVEDVSGITKSFIDRLAYMGYRPALAGKTALCVTTSGLGASGHALRTMAAALHVWGLHICGKQNLRTGGKLDGDTVPEALMPKIKSAAWRLFNAIRHKKYFKPSVYSLLAFTVQQSAWKKASGPKLQLSRDYWQENGWFNKGVTFYFPHRANPIKTAFSRALGKAAALFFI